ncbi:hypothetical protein [Microbacterium sp. 8M]|jgi:hypothetical protein|uniref:hypothetical protein n=1 Tax=Microbacterium sp. 8M TaxID=2653153 RepID=UPI001356AFAB|nr:hypothetical protein [Microbacterium sp. 8M]
MSVELVGVVIAASAVLVTLGIGLFAGFAWVVRRIDRVEDKLSARFDGVSARFDGVSARFDGVEAELTEVKIAIARLEGPRPHLILGR